MFEIICCIFTVIAIICIWMIVWIDCKVFKMNEQLLDELEKEHHDIIEALKMIADCLKTEEKEENK